MTVGTRIAIWSRLPKHFTILTDELLRTAAGWTYFQPTFCNKYSRCCELTHWDFRTSAEKSFGPFAQWGRARLGRQRWGKVEEKIPPPPTRHSGSRDPGEPFVAIGGFWIPGVGTLRQMQPSAKLSQGGGWRMARRFRAPCRTSETEKELVY